MEILSKIQKINHKSLELKEEGETIGFVPTMGYLHEGHLSLIRTAAKENSKVIASIFVNPIQFGPGEDFEKYPRNFKRDYALARDAGCNYIFKPGINEIYGKDFKTFVIVEEISSQMCGYFRPGHFRGVTTVVLKLFNIVNPHRAYFGLKDYQQFILIQKMVEDLNIPVKVIGCPIVREGDGLAMSSRNKYLSEKEREKAPILFKNLGVAAEFIENGKTDLIQLKRKIMQIFEQEPLVKKVEYFDIRDAETLSLVEDLYTFKRDHPGRHIVIVSAIWIGSTRLIDNIIL